MRLIYSENLLGKFQGQFFNFYSTCCLTDANLCLIVFCFFLFVSKDKAAAFLLTFFETYDIILSG